MEPPLKKAKVSEETRLGREQKMTSKKKRVFLSDLDFFFTKTYRKVRRETAKSSMSSTSRQEEDAGNDTSARIKACSSPKLTCHFLSLLVTFLNFLHIMCFVLVLCLFSFSKISFWIRYNIIMLYYFHSIFDVFLYSLSADLPILWSVPRFQWFQWFHVRRCLPSWQRKARSKCRSSKYEPHKCKYKCI